MQIKVNGQPVLFEAGGGGSAGMNLEQLLVFYKLKKDMVVIELNRAVPSKSAYASTFIKDGDEIEIVKFLGGG